MRIEEVREIVPEASRCIEVDSADRLFASGGPDGVTFVTHNSVVQRNIIFGAIMRPDAWRFLGIDLKKVELSAYRAYKNVVLGIATTLEDALVIMRFAQQTMMKRYEEMEELGFNNFLDLPERGQALMVMVDEAGELLSPTGAGTDEAKAQDELKGEATMIISSIARLGRAAGVHLVIATQRPDAKIIPGETKANLHVRINCGHTDSNASLMILGNGEGMRVKSNPRGRLYLSIHGTGNHGQGFFAEQSWIDDYLRSQGKNPDGSPLGQSVSRLADLGAVAELDGVDLDSREGVDNKAFINEIKEREARGDYRDGDYGGSSEYAASVPQPSAADDAEMYDGPGGMGRPELMGNTGEDKFHRPEDDWDSDLENLIEQNND